MIELDAKSFALSEAIETIPSALRIALRLEFATIPVYLYALYSLDTVESGKNQVIHDLLRSVVIVEMLHMAQVANILIALGEPPILNTPGLVPTYPNPLPGGVEAQLTIGLEPFSLDLVENTFLVIEEPETPLVFAAQAAAAPPLTIGRFYANINQTIQTAAALMFPGDPTHQVSFTSGQTKLISITGKQSVADAIDLIVEQGEGTTTTPQDLQKDFAHYYRFQEILKGKKLIPKPDATPTDLPEKQFIYSTAPADAIPFDPSGVRPVPTNPKAADYAPGSPERVANDTFNTTYTALIVALHEVFNGHPEKMNATRGTMGALKNQALALTKTVRADGTHAGPTFEFIVTPTPPVPIPSPPTDADPMILTSFAQVQTYLSKLLTESNQLADTQNNSPHGDWWNTLTYEQFVGGNVPGVQAPVTNQPMPTLVIGHADQSNLVLSLTGAAGTAFDPSTGAIGRMPADGPPFFTADQIKPLADWIDAGCPK